jgi:hypothetical protein
MPGRGRGGSIIASLTVAAAAALVVIPTMNELAFEVVQSK